MVKLEVGKYYKTRDGRKVGPMQRWDEYGDNEKDGTPLFDSPGAMWDGAYWQESGTSGESQSLDQSRDIVSEWYTSCAAAQVDVQRDEYGPIRTRREIVPGMYGSVSVHDRNGDKVWVESIGSRTAEELREAAHLFNQLAEVLDDNRS